MLKYDITIIYNITTKTLTCLGHFEVKLIGANVEIVFHRTARVIRNEWRHPKDSLSDKHKVSLIAERNLTS